MQAKNPRVQVIVMRKNTNTDEACLSEKYSFK